jgi:hypothetical protein
MHRTNASAIPMGKRVPGETRNPKPETRKKSEGRNPNKPIVFSLAELLQRISPQTPPVTTEQPHLALAPHPSVFGPRFSAFLRFSDFVLRIS